MKMIIAIVSNHDVNGLLVDFSGHGIRATKLASSGGFLREGNTTLLIGVEDTQVEEVLNRIRANCSARSITRTDVIGMHDSPLFNLIPLEVEISGATVFVLPMDQLLKF